MYPRFTLAAIAVASLFVSPAQAADAQDEGLIVVTATRQATRHNELLSDVTTIEREEIEHSSMTTLGEVLSKKAGLHVVASGGPGSNVSVFIRGANSSHTLVLIDGVRYGSATTGQASLENIPLSSIERIEVLRGPASSLYGSDAIGGVIQIFTRKNETAGGELFVGSGSHGTHEFNGGLSAGNQLFNLNLNAGYLVTKGFDALNDPADNDGFKQSNGSGNLTLNLPQKGQLGINVLVANGRNDIDSGNPRDSYIDKEASMLSAFWKQPLGEHWTSTLSTNETKDDQASHDTGNDSVIITKRRQTSWQNDLRVKLGAFLLGAERTDEYVTNSGGALAADERHIDSFFGGWTGRVENHRWQLNARRDLNQQFGNKNTGALAYGYQLSSDWRAHGSVGTGFKAPTFNDLYFPLMCFGAFGCFGGNPNLKPEKARNQEIGLNWEPVGQQAALTYFKNKIEDLIVWSNQPFNVGEAKIEGYTMTYRLERGQNAAGIEYTSMKAVNAANGQRLIRRPKEQLTISLKHRAGNWNLGGEMLAVSNREDLDFATNSRARLAGYALLNAYAERSLGGNWSVELRGNNLSDRQYTPAFGFRADGRTVFVGLRYRNR